ncbi:MAG: translation initiation factor IF-3 [Firmicutes bacterium]|nr:translation initiation factor IF-3 [Bacillota bacterium]
MSRGFQVNEGIRAREVRLIDVNGKQLGIMPTREALRISRDHELDLVVVAPNAKPPVCRIMDYDKYKYEQSKREKEARKKQKVITVKEVRLRPNIEEHDLNVKMRNAMRFLTSGDKVKVTVRFRGRQIAYKDAGRELLAEIAEGVKELGVIEKGARVEGRQMTMVLAPRQEQLEK